MPDQWYYTQDNVKSGPCSAEEIRELAAGGIILPTDTISKEGNATEVLAKNVKNLFASLPTPVVEEETTEQGQLVDEDSDYQATAEERATEPAPKPPAPIRTSTRPRPGRAVALKGAIIMGQDGVTVNYRKKCTKCGYEDQARQRMAIHNGVTRTHFFCPKCKRGRPVEIQGFLT
jgi:hypothetical protein